MNPVKTFDIDELPEGFIQTYTIEEFERAIDKLPFSQVLRNTIKVYVKNNLKK